MNFIRKIQDPHQGCFSKSGTGSGGTPSGSAILSVGKYQRIFHGQVMLNGIFPQKKGRGEREPQSSVVDPDTDLVSYIKYNITIIFTFKLRLKRKLRINFMMLDPDSSQDRI